MSSLHIKELSLPGNQIQGQRLLLNDFARTIRINRQDGPSITVNQLQTKKWADLTAPDSTKILMDLVQKTMEIQENGKDTILVHCSAGVGRTGTFIAVYKLVAQYLDNK